MARTTNAPPPSNDSTLVERPQTWQEFQTCVCGRFWLWEQTEKGRQRVSPVGLPHVCRMTAPEILMPPPSETRDEGTVASLKQPLPEVFSASIAQQREETQPQA